MAGPIVRVSTDTSGYFSTGSRFPQFLADSRTVVFASNEGGAFSRDAYTLYTKDLVSGQVTKLGASAFGGTNTYGASISNIVVSSDGRTVAFVDRQSQPGDATDVLFVQDTASGIVTEVTTTAINSDTSINPTFSPDGTKLVFASSDPTLVPGDTNGALDVFVRDLASGTVTRASTAAGGAQASLAESSPRPAAVGERPFFTADGSKVVFTSTASDLVAGDTNGRADVFVKDLGTGAISLVAGTAGFQADAISADGSKFLLQNYNSRYTVSELATYGKLYSLDTKTGALTTVATTDTSLGIGIGRAFDASYSPDGGKVLYSVGEARPGLPFVDDLIALEDLATGIRVTLGGRGSYDASFSPDGMRVTFSGGDIQTDPNKYSTKPNVYEQDLFSPVFGQRVTDASGNGGKVYALYQGLLGRAPDSLGLEVNTNAVDAGASLRDLASAFLASPEGQARSGAATDAAFVTQLYRTTLNREPDQAGLDNYVSYLGAGGARADVAVGFALSPEYLATLAPTLAAGVIVTDQQAAQAARLYYAVFDRAPDAGGLVGWTNYLDQGGSLAGAADAFLASPESRAAGSSDNATFVRSLYLNALDRPADAGGLANWVGYLDAGGSRGAVTAAIANSTEAQVHLTGVIENGWFLSA